MRRPLPASLRAILLDPRADPDRALGVRVGRWQPGDGLIACHVAAVTRDGEAVAVAQVAAAGGDWWNAVLWDGASYDQEGGRVIAITHCHTLRQALAVAESDAVGFALGNLPRRSGRPRRRTSR